MNDNFFNSSDFSNPVLSSLQNVDSLAGFGALADTTRSAISTTDSFAAMDGVFTVGTGGLFSIDVLADNGAYEGQIGVFSLTGMENFQVGSADFMKEAAHRAAANSGQGYLLFDDATEGVRFNSQLGETDCNSGNYEGAKTVRFAAGEQVALILVPNGSLNNIAAGRMWGAEQPLFSMSAANGGAIQLAKVSTNTFGWEDIGGNSSSDADYNDIVFKMTGASGQVAPISEVVNTDRAWQNSASGQQLLNFGNKSNAVLGWNKAALEAIKTDKTNPPIASRNLAILETAVYDAVNGLTAFYNSYQVNLGANDGASVEAAASEAAYRVLIELYPSQKATFDDILNGFLQDLPHGESVDKGLAYGKAVAEATLATRTNDGSKTVMPYVASSEIGQWQPTGLVTSPLLPHWGKVTPFALTSSNQFRPDAPPALNSAAYAQELNLTKDLGSISSSSRTADQTEIAKFWADGGGTYTPPGHWNDIANQLLGQNNTSLVESAHTLGLLSIALADAAIACWDAKYTYNAWRPVTAIRQADLDGNAATTADATWQSLLTTPPFPEYTSGHSTFSATAAAVLSGLMGDNVSFSTSSIGLPGITRNYTSFQQAAQEAGISRIYGGIHFMFANTSGLQCGQEIGSYVVENFMQSKTA